MKSKAHIKSHPLHPILIPFPIAFFIGTFVFDVLSFVGNDSDFHRTAFYLTVAGISTALLAAIPGIIDYIHTVPPESSAKKRATRHGLLNISTVVLFLIALTIRTPVEVTLPVLLLELAAIVILSVAGWMGGTLVHRNQIGIDIRYAGAGKWNEQVIDHPGEMAEVATIDELKINQMKLLLINKRRIVLARTEEGHQAFDDRCPHKGGSLAGGAIICGTVQCPWHGSQFSAATGTVKAGPAKQPITTYPILEQNGKVYLILKRS